MTGPLASLRIIEMVGIGPCPLAGQLLADLGAEVIVIDRKSGQNVSKDVNRRGKKSIAIDLKAPEGIAVARKLIGAADILIEGFRPGVMERLGLGPADCMADNPRLVYGRMTGWGQTGPLSHSAGHDINYLAITGALHAMGRNGEPPVPPLNLVADYGGGSMFLIMGILAAVIDRGVSGEGRIVDAAMADGVPAMMGLIQSMFAQGLWTINREDNFIDGGAPWYRCYACSDGKFVAVGAIEPQFFSELVRLLDLNEDLLSAQNDKSAWPDMHSLLEKTFATKSRDEWAALFEGTDACVAPVLDFLEAETYANNVQRTAFFRKNGVLQTSPAPRFNGNAIPFPEPGTKTGLDGHEILKAAGIDDEIIKRLENSNILI